MLNRTPRTTRHLGLAGILAVALSLVLVTSAAAVVYIYKNNFQSASKYREIDQTGGGKAACDESYSSGSESFRIEMKRKMFCEYSPPVIGDRQQPDHEIVAVGRVLKSTPKNVREDAYLGVRVRVGDNTFYEFRVNPKLKKYKLSRNPSGVAAGPPVAGTSASINRLGAKNNLRLRITDNQVRAFVNGDSVAAYVDPSPGDVTGRRVAFGLGSTKDAKNGPIGVFKFIKVGVPSP